jgi:PD-(D/E)XK endonuclease
MGYKKDIVATLPATGKPRQKTSRWPTRKREGEVAEAAFLSKAASLGFGVAKPWGDSDPFDFILHSGPRCWRVQVKSVQRKYRGRYLVRALYSKSRYSKDEIDFLVAYVVPENAWYIVPVDDVSRLCGLWFNPNPGSRSYFERYREAWCQMACPRDGPCKEEIIVHRHCAPGNRQDCPFALAQPGKTAD